MAVRRFQRQVQYAPQTTSTGASDVAGVLAAKLQQFSGTAYQVAARGAEARGLAEGAQAGGVAAPEKRSDLTIAGDAFNRAALKAHAAAVDTEIRMKLAEYADAHPADPDAFQGKAEALSKGLMGGVDPSIKGPVEQEFALQTQRYLSDIVGRKRKLVAEQTFADTMTGVEGARSGALQAARSLDLDMMEHERGKAADLILGLVRTPENPDGPLTAEQARDKVAALDADLDAETLLGGMQKVIGETPTTDSLNAARKQLDGFRALDAKTLGIAPEQKDKVQARLEAMLVDGEQSYRRRVDLETGEDAVARGRAWGDLYRKVADGTATVSEVENAYQSELIDPKTRGSWLAQLDDAAAKRGAAAAGIARVADALQGRAFLDPKKDSPTGRADHAAVDEYYRAMVEGQDPLSPEMLTRTAELAKVTGIVPESVRAIMRSFQNSPDPNRVVAGAELAGRLQATAGPAFADIPAEDRAFAQRVNNLVKSGTAPALAVDLARKTVYDTDPAVRDKWDAEFKTQDKRKEMGKALVSRIAADFDPVGWTGSPDAAAELGAEFENLTRHYYTLNRNMDEAADLAWADLKKTWGVTRIGGKRRLMKGAPEALYGEGDWLGEQFADDMRAHGLDPEKVTIHADSDTVRTWPPTYALWTTDDNGLPRQLPGYWAPDHSLRAMKARGEVEAAKMEAVAEAEKARPAMLAERERGRKAAEARARRLVGKE